MSVHNNKIKTAEKEVLEQNLIYVTHLMIYTELI